METATALGTVAGALTTFALLPQAYRIWRTRSADDVSLATFVTMSLGIALWTVYGVMIGSAPVVVFNCITLLLSMVILALKVRYRKR